MARVLGVSTKLCSVMFCQYFLGIWLRRQRGLIRSDGDGLVEMLPQPLKIQLVPGFLGQGDLPGLHHIPRLHVVDPAQPVGRVVDEEGLHTVAVHKVGHHHRHHVVLGGNLGVKHAVFHPGKPQELGEQVLLPPHQAADAVDIQHVGVGQVADHHPAHLEAPAHIAVDGGALVPVAGKEGLPDLFVGLGADLLGHPRLHPAGLGLVGVDVGDLLAEGHLQALLLGHGVGPLPAGIGLEHGGHEAVEAAVVDIYQAHTAKPPPISASCRGASNNDSCSASGAGPSKVMAGSAPGARRVSAVRLW